MYSLLPIRKTVKGSPRVSLLRLAREAIRCNIAGLYPHILNCVGIKPLYANFWVTTRCSGRCKTCKQWQERDPVELTTGQLKEILFMLNRGGIRIVYFVGGDVFLRGDIFELIECASGMGLRVHLTINAFTVTEKIAQALMASQISSLHLSLDMLSEDLDCVRGVPDSAEKVIRSLNLLKEASNHRIRLGLSTTIMKCTLPSIRDIVRFAINNDLTIFFNLINFTHHFFSTEFSREQYTLNSDEKKELYELVQWLKERHMEHPDLIPRMIHLEWIRDYFNDHCHKWPPCYQTLLKICIRPNGDVRPCCSMETVGNLCQQELKKILRSKAYISLLKKALMKECPGCSCRYTLNLDVSLGSYIKEYLHYWRR